MKAPDRPAQTPEYLLFVDFFKRKRQLSGSCKTVNVEFMARFYPNGCNSRVALRLRDMRFNGIETLPSSGFESIVNLVSGDKCLPRGSVVDIKK